MSDEQGTSEETEESSEALEAGEPLLIQNLKKTFDDGSIVACENVDIEINPDEFVTLLGPSGCGKTTTLRCIAGLETPDDGKILIGDEEVTTKKPKDRDLAYVFQSIALFPHMSVRDNMRFGLDMTTDLSGETKEEQVREVASLLNIEDYLDRKPTDLSGGQQQRVSIGRAMVMEPAAFLLDEPFSNLDANLRDQMQTEVKRLQRRLNRAMIFVTHDQSEAMTLADKIVIMNDGIIQQKGDPHEIYNDPANQFVAGFIGSPSTNMIECRVETAGSDLVLQNEAFRLTVTGEWERALSDRTGEEVTLGIRPEYLTLDEERGYFDADIELVEPEGRHDTVHLSADDLELRASVPQGELDSQGTVSVGFDLDQAWVFDVEGERLV